MPEPRRAFRIEHGTAEPLDPPVETSQAWLHCHSEIMRELAELRASLQAAVPRPCHEEAARGGELARVADELTLLAGIFSGSNERPACAVRSGARVSEETLPPSRLRRELAAIVNGAERATLKILAAAEEIDTAAASLSAALDGTAEQQSAQDIQDLVIRILEACNFQDLLGQRVAKAMAALQFVEERIAHMLAELNGTAAPPLHGPRLDGDAGHASQREVDEIFAANR